jgi:hypothetical protein
VDMAWRGFKINPNSFLPQIIHYPVLASIAKPHKG